MFCVAYNFGERCGIAERVICQTRGEKICVSGFKSIFELIRVTLYNTVIILVREREIEAPDYIIPKALY